MRLNIKLLALVGIIGVLSPFIPAGDELPGHTGAVTMAGKPLTLLGNLPETGKPAPDFKLVSNSLAPVTLADTEGIRILVSVPSLDTSVCDAEVKRFNEEAAGLKNVTIYVISADLPFAQKRWCGSNSVDNVITLSDYQDMSFGNNWGVHIKEFRLLARAVFVLDSSNQIVYRELVGEITEHPDYPAALEAAKSAE